MTLGAGEGTDAARVAIAHEAVPAEQVVAGSPTTGWTDLGDGLGVWEMTPGAMRDVEADEVFVVTAGSARIEFDDPRHPHLDLAPGSVVRLVAGLRTVWTVHETLRKVFVTGPGP